MTQRDRCKAFLSKLQRDGILRQGSPVDDLLAFLQSEVGRTADPSLADAKSLILYFGSSRDRLEFMDVVRQAKPGMVAKEVP